MKFRNRYDVIGLGSLAVDFIGQVAEWPAAGTKNKLQGLDIYDGGLTGTALVAVARLGGKAAFLGKKGSSEMAKRAFASLGSEGIDLSMMSTDPESEPVIAMVFSSITEQERNIFFQKNNLKFPFPEEIPDKNWYRKTNVFFTDHVAGAAGVEAAKIAAEAGVEVVVDIERYQDNTEALLFYADHIIVGEKFARLYSGSENTVDQLKALRKREQQKVIITRGEKGCTYRYRDIEEKVPGFKINVKDTTGCGDVFHGVYALCVSRNYSTKHSLVLANAAAAMKARHSGGRPGIPSEKELNNFLYEKKSKLRMEPKEYRK